MIASRTILLVEDEALIAMSEAAMFRRQGYEVVVAMSGEEAIEKVEAAPGGIALILMDIDLGVNRMDGTQAAQEILKKHDIPILFLSSHAEPEVVAKTEKITSYGYVVKGSSITVMTASIKMAFRLHEANQTIRNTNANLLQEITERKQVEDRLRQSEAKYRTIVETASEGIVVTDIEGRYTFINQQMADMLGYPIEEILGKTSMDLVDDGWTQQVVQKRKGLRGGDPASGEFKYRRKDGSALWTIYHATPAFNDQGEHIADFAIHTDITERKREEAIVMARVRIAEFAAHHSLGELMQNAVDELCVLTESPIGFFHFVEANQRALSLQTWSTRTLDEFCKTEGKGQHYDMDQAGVWVDCVREGRAVIHNDYASLPHRKGLPEGHAPVMREMVLPIHRNQRIVAIIGVGNKAVNYTEEDISYAFRLADLIWDLVERKRAEDALQKSEARHRVLFETAPVGIELADMDGHIIETNAAAMRIFGLSAEEYGRRKIDGPEWRIIRPDGTPMPPDEYAGIRALKEQKPIQNVEMGVIRDQDDVAWISVNAAPIPGVGVAISYVEYTERKRAEDALHESEQRWQFALEGAGEGVWDWDAQTNQVYFSRQWKAMLGFAEGEVGNTLDEWDKRVHPDDRQDVYKKINAHFSRKTPVYQSEHRVRCKDGGYKWILDRGKVIKWMDDGRPLRVIGTHTDITERKCVEEELRQALAEKDILMRELQHRVKNSLMIAASMINLEEAGLADERARMVFASVQSRINAMAAVYEQLYRTNGIDRISLVWYIRQLVAGLSQSYISKSGLVNIKTQLEETQLDLKRALPLGIILNELITNALKHAFPPGSTTPERPGTILVELSRSGDRANLRVADNGVGIPAEKLRNGGTGLELVKMLTRQIGGSFEIDNKAVCAVQVSFRIGISDSAE